MLPIKGDRYKCVVRPNFDICKKCEKNNEHPYPFYKIDCPSKNYFAMSDFVS